jgi:prolipoprotein diacylglyceryl transferase
VPAGFIFDFDPAIARLGPLQLRWYGLMFAAAFWIAFALWYRALRRGGYNRDTSVGYLPWFLISLLLGARLGHCLFYEPAEYLARPLEILRFWKGGLSSHGATMGLLAGLYLFCRRHGLRYLDIVDRFSPSAAVAAALVRLGNLMNSEIVGRPTDLPCGFRFVRFDCEAADLCGVFDTVPHTADPRWRQLLEATPARHPTQLYEFLMGLVVLGTLVVVDRRFGREERPVGLITGTFGVVYFGLRFLVELLKERQGTPDDALLSLGQLMSIPLFLTGVYLVWQALRRVEPASGVPIPPRFSRDPDATRG